MSEPSAVPPALTPRERVVLLAVGQRLTNGEIAELLKVSKRTVESHIASLFAKFGVQKRLELIAIAATDTGGLPPAGLVGTNELMWRELTRLREQLRQSAVAADIQRTLDWASGMLFERYRLPDLAAAANVLHEVAGRHGLDVVELAATVLASPSPQDDRRTHPGRGPELTFVDEADADLSSVLNGALDASTICAEAEQGDLQLASSGGLDLVVSRGFSKAFVAHFAHVDGKATACALALATRTPVSVPDVATSEIYQPQARITLGAARVRTVHSIPMLTEHGACVGVVSTHRPRPRQQPSRATQRVLEGIATQTGAWLAWHQRAVRFDALADLHDEATRYPRVADNASGE